MKKVAGQEDIAPRRGMPDVTLDAATFRGRFLAQFDDPLFAPCRKSLNTVADIAWRAYADGHKSPLTRKAGPGHADPDFALPVDWIEARRKIDAAARRHADRAAKPRILVINGSPRSEHSCPGEMSKSWRLADLARTCLEKAGCATDSLDLSRLTSEYGRHIHPCKACFSTAAALCHWPCSCYPNHGLGQVQDWMNDIYPLWVAAHGVLIVTPVHWYQASSPLKLMIDRLVCADGGNPDPTSTHGKDPEQAKRMELAGWHYPKHLAGRLFALVVHGDSAGVETLRRMLADWLESMALQSAGGMAALDRYIGYYQPYATSHQALDGDAALQQEVRNVALSLSEAVHAQRTGKLVEEGRSLKDPRPK